MPEEFDIEYDQPTTFPSPGGANFKEYWNSEISIIPYVVSLVDKGEVRDDNRILGAGPWDGAIIEGPIILVVSTGHGANGRNHATDIVTVPFDTRVRFRNSAQAELEEDTNIFIAPVEEYSPLQTSAIVGVPSGVAGAAGGQYFLENPFIGIVTALIGGGGGYAYERSKFSEYSVERVK